MCVRVYAYTERDTHTHTHKHEHTNTHQNALSSDDAPRYPLPWKSAAQLSLLLTDPLSGRQERRAVKPHPRTRCGSPWSSGALVMMLVGAVAYGIH